MRIHPVLQALGVLLSLVLFGASTWYLISRFEWRLAFNELATVNWQRFALVCFLGIFSFNLVRAWRLLLLVRWGGATVRYREILFTTMVVLNMSTYTPGAIGEAMKIEWLKRKGLLGRVEASGGFLIEKLADFLCIALFAMSGFMITGTNIYNYKWIEPLALGLITIVILIIVFLPKLPLKGKLGEFQRRLCNENFNFRNMSSLFGVTILSWLVIVAEWYSCFQLVDSHISILGIIWLIGCISLASFISLIPGGLGISELLIIEMIVFLGQSSLIAQKSALILRLFGLVSLMIGIILTLMKIIQKIIINRASE